MTMSSPYTRTVTDNHSRDTPKPQPLRVALRVGRDDSVSATLDAVGSQVGYLTGDDARDLAGALPDAPS